MVARPSASLDRIARSRLSAPPKQRSLGTLGTGSTFGLLNRRSAGGDPTVGGARRLLRSSQERQRPRVASAVLPCVEEGALSLSSSSALDRPQLDAGGPAERSAMHSKIGTPTRGGIAARSIAVVKAAPRAATPGR